MGAIRIQLETVNCQRLIGVDVNDGLRKGLRSFLRQIVPDAARDSAVRVVACELLCIRSGLRMWSAIGIAFHGDSRHGDDWTWGKPLVQIVVFALAIRQRKPPPIIMDRDGER